MASGPERVRWIEETTTSTERTKGDTMKLSVTDLRSANRVRIGFVVRPEGQLGSCGWAPKAWTAVPIYSLRENPIAEFLRVNTNWNPSDISGIIS